MSSLIYRSLYQRKLEIALNERKHNERKWDIRIERGCVGGDVGEREREKEKDKVGPKHLSSLGVYCLVTFINFVDSPEINPVNPKLSVC